MARQKMKFNLADCIVIGDARLLKEGKSPVKTLRRLVYRLVKKRGFQDLSAEALYAKLYRYQNTGFFLTSNDGIAEDICDILMVNKKELVVKWTLEC